MHIWSTLVLLNLSFSSLLRKELQFSLFSQQDVVKLSEFQVSHRDLYTQGERLPARDGVLDKRLVRTVSLVTNQPFLHYYRAPPTKQVCARRVVTITKIVLGIMPISN